MLAAPGRIRAVEPSATLTLCPAAWQVNNLMANRIFLITQYIEKRKSGFGVARLMMMSGVNVRGFAPQDPEQPESLERVQRALPELLSALELRELERILSEPAR